MSAHIFLIHNLITGCFLSHRNPIRRNLLLPNAQTHAPMRPFSPASQVPVVKLITFPPLADAEAGHLGLRGHYRGSWRGGFIGASPTTSTAGSEMSEGKRQRWNMEEVMENWSALVRDVRMMGKHGMKPFFIKGLIISNTVPGRFFKKGTLN